LVFALVQSPSFPAALLAMTITFVTALAIARNARLIDGVLTRIAAG